MLLLDLPPELFEQIINDLVRGESSAKMFKYREISRIFDTYVLDALSKRPIGRGKRDVYRKFGARFPTAFGHAILSKLVLQRSDTSRAVITFVTGIVDMLVDRSVQSDTDNRETLRTLHVQQICNAFRAAKTHFVYTFLMTELEIMECDHQRLLPAAAAAVGDVKIFLDNISNVSQIFAVHHTYFPNALDAAVAAGQTEMVKTILWYAVNNTRGPWITGNWKEMRITSMALFRALQVAIQFHQSEIGHLIAYTLSENRHLHESIPGKLNEELYEDCILHSNVEFLTLALHHKREAAWLSPDGSLDKPTQDEMMSLLKRCRKSMLGPLVRKKLLHLNRFGSVTTIWACLKLKRYDFVKVLLELGANIDGEPPGGGMPAFWRATAEERFEDAEFLFQQGASVQPWKPKKRALRVLSKDKK